jgi:hypothetical protein
MRELVEQDCDITGDGNARSLRARLLRQKMKAQVIQFLLSNSQEWYTIYSIGRGIKSTNHILLRFTCEHLTRAGICLKDSSTFHKTLYKISPDIREPVDLKVSWSFPR